MRDNRASLEYHLQELAIARSPGDARRALPDIGEKDSRVLDVGCGIGQTLLALGVSAGSEAHGVDIDETAIAFGNAHYPELRLRTGAGEALPYGDKYFDLVICRVSLPYMHIPTALREFSRVLVPRGRLWLVLHPLSMLRTDLAHAWTDRSVRSLLYRGYALTNTLALAVNRQYRYPLNRARIESYQPALLMRRALRRTGFLEVRTWTDNGQSFATAFRES